MLGICLAVGETFEEMLRLQDLLKCWQGSQLLYTSSFVCRHADCFVVLSLMSEPCPQQDDVEADIAVASFDRIHRTYTSRV